MSYKKPIKLKKNKKENSGKPAFDRRDRRNDRGDFEGKQEDANLIRGRNPVIEALKSGRTINKVIAAAGQEAVFTKQIKELCKEHKIPYQEAERGRLDNITHNHQGVIAYGSPVDYVDVDDILQIAKAKSEDPFIVILAEVEDPHNLGAIMRTCECAGVHGIIIAKHGAAPVTETVVKVAAGAAEYMPVARVANISMAIQKLKESGVWVAGADMEGAETLWKSDLTGGIALVMGSEGKGIPPLVAKNCDFMIKIPMFGQINSLNVSAGAAVIIYEIVRQRLNDR
ncbi:MAG: 23S rRNA (guanosine(2251)-2'-O)-methyltransferase RlmB [Bacillota bacterium]|jgi:23S rRNA (guanosine2251-2'-O)-methyltransferase